MLRTFLKLLQMIINGLCLWGLTWLVEYFYLTNFVVVFSLVVIAIFSYRIISLLNAINTNIAIKHIYEAKE